MTPSADAKLMPMSELTETETAIATLCRELGPAKTARFIIHFSTGGDYIAERAAAADSRTVDEVIAELELPTRFRKMSRNELFRLPRPFGGRSFVGAKNGEEICFLPQ